LLLLLVITLFVLLFGGKKLEMIFYLSMLLVMGGSLEFLYLYLRGQLWQAGKAFTYAYPFLMISIAVLPFGLEKIGKQKFIYAIARALVSIWLVLPCAEPSVHYQDLSGSIHLEYRSLFVNPCTAGSPTCLAIDR